MRCLQEVRGTRGSTGVCRRWDIYRGLEWTGGGKTSMEGWRGWDIYRKLKSLGG